MGDKELEIYDVKPDEDFTKAVKCFIKKKRFYSLPQQIENLIADLEKGTGIASFILKVALRINGKFWKFYTTA